jgi:uncharacterized repeat protein (TIGR01451 family)
MKRLLLLALLFFVNKFLQAQTYSQGDITAFANINGTHDSSQCGSFANESYFFTIANSFVGDSITIRDQNTGSVLDYEVNLLGQNPWNVTLFPLTLNPFVQDEYVTNGLAYFSGFAQMKFINGLDTIYNINSFFALPVPNPCTYGTISGKMYIDNNADCIFNGTDAALASLGVNGSGALSNGGNFQKYGYTNANGEYEINMQKSWMTSYNVNLPINYAFIFPPPACAASGYTIATLPYTNADFPLQCSANLDAMAYVGINGSVRPMVPFVLHASAANIGCTATSGVLTVVKDPKTIYNATLSSNPATYVNGDTLQWNYTNLNNISSGAYWNSFFAGVYLTPTLAANIGDTLCFYYSATIPTGDINTANNQGIICAPVVNSYDPNIKEVTPKGFGVNGNIPPNTSNLDYTVHFQNTGNAVAFNVYILDTLDADVDPRTLIINGASHYMTAEWLNNTVVKFNFPNIYLPDSTNNEPRSHGQVSYSVKLKNNLPLGTQIKNTANIFFDFNPAIVTNTTVNTLALPDAITSNNNGIIMSIYPNPTKEILNLNFENNEAKNITLLSINGQTLFETICNSKTDMIKTEKIPNGIYILKVATSNGVVSKRVVINK